jgi:hypothetical protein
MPVQRTHRSARSEKTGIAEALGALAEAIRHAH